MNCCRLSAIVNSKIIVICPIFLILFFKGYSQNAEEIVIKNKITGREWVIHDGQKIKVVRSDDIVIMGNIIKNDSVLIAGNEIIINSHMNKVNCNYNININEIKDIIIFEPAAEYLFKAPANSKSDSIEDSVTITSNNKLLKFGYPKNIIKTEYFVYFYFERVTFKSQSIQFSYGNIVELTNFFNGKITGHEYTVEYRFYPYGHAPDGFYIGPYYLNAKGNAYTGGSDYNASGTFNLNWQGPGINFGSQWIMGGFFSLNIYFGLGFYKATNSNLIATANTNDGPLQGYTGFPYGGLSISCGFTFGIAF